MSIMHSNILLMSNRAFHLDIFLVVLRNISYLILIQQDHLGVMPLKWGRISDLVVMR